MPSIYKNDIALLSVRSWNTRESVPIRTTVGPRLMLSYAGKRLWERERVPRTCDQTINDRVQIDFRVPHKDFAGVRTGLGNRVRVLLRSAAVASVLENPQEIESVCV